MSSNAFRMQTAAMEESTEVLHAGDSLQGRRMMRQADAGMPAPLDPNLAIAKEKAYIAMRSAQYSVLLQKIKDYQGRSNLAPSDEEIEKWREGMEYRIATRRLQSGMVDVRFFPNCSSLPLS